jgi:ABC-2 type transport system ATP-binding protein
VTVLVSSHLLAEVEATCTHVAVLHDGTVVSQGELTELLESGSPALLVSTPDSERAVEMLRENRITSRLTPDGVRVDLTTTSAPEVLEHLVRGGVGVHEATRARTGLEDLFARLTQNGAEVSTRDGLSEVDGEMKA